MKPLPVVPWTDEDHDIWLHRWWQRFGIEQWYLEGISVYADRRDAEVMLQLCHFDHWERDYTQDRLRRTATALRLVRHQL